MTELEEIKTTLKKLHPAEYKKVKEYINRQALEIIRLNGTIKVNVDLTDIEQVLPRRLSNSAYIRATKGTYENFMTWWDDQV